MLKVSIHAGLLSERNAANQIGVIDIGYKKRDFLSDYIVAMQLSGKGECATGELARYPRWSCSIWDLVARAITVALYQSDAAPEVPRIDRRCAYATKLCAIVQHLGIDERGEQLGSVEILQPGRVRGQYQAVFEEDILGRRAAQFEYGCKVLNVADLLLRAICHSMWGKDTLGPFPGLVVPAFIKVNGEERFDAQSLTEPARTGFRRYQARYAASPLQDSLSLADDYAKFLVQS